MDLHQKYLHTRCLTPWCIIGAVATAVSTPASAPASTAGFGDKFKKPEGSWECEVCCVQNKAEDQQCVACQSAKPGAKIESKGKVSCNDVSRSQETSKQLLSV